MAIFTLGVACPSATIHVVSAHAGGLHLRRAGLGYCPTQNYPVQLVQQALTLCDVIFHFTAVSLQNLHVPCPLHHSPLSVS